MNPRLLVIECWGVGDLAIATPFLRAASERYRVTLLAKPHALDLRSRFWPEVEVVPYVVPWTAFRHKYRLNAWPWLELGRLVRQLRREQFDIGLSARWDPRDHLLLWLVGARQRLGFARAGSGMLLTRPLERPAAEAHQYEYWRAMAAAMELPMPNRAAAMPATAPRSGTVVFHTGAAQTVRVWPLPRFQQMARELRAAGHPVRLACDANQRSWWLNAGEPDVATPTSVRELLAILDGAACFIGNDSGPGHLAAACGLPTFTLFGPQLPFRFVPLHRDSEWVEGWNCPHRPCRDYCRFPVPYCLERLPESEVLTRVRAFVARHTKPA
jgi:ADP-heptose:LPS heptosyltransferase